jgi:hypothetical protein
LIWISYRAPVSPLAKIENHTVAEIIKINVINNQHPIVLPFTATENQLGMLLVYIKPLSAAEEMQLGIQKDDQVILTDLRAIVKCGDDVINQTDFPIYQIYSNRFFTIGLPIQSNSANKEYQLELSITDQSTHTNLALINEKSALKSVYFQSKQYYLKNPRILVRLILEKAVQPFTESNAQIALLYASPFFLMMIMASCYRKH